MKRLRESPERSPLLDKARELLDAVDTLPNVEVRRARVRAAIEERSRSAPRRRVPAFALAVVLTLIGASAFAAVRIYGVVRSRVANRETQAEAKPERRTRPPTQSSPAPRVVEAPIADSEPVPEPERERSEVARARATKPVRARSKVERSAPELQPPSMPEPVEQKSEARTTRTSEEVRASQSAIVHRALAALRRDRDAKKALQLLDELARQSLDGPLREEAHALQIEAALEVDGKRARTLAREYLERFPAGRYRALARRALGDAG